MINWLDNPQAIYVMTAYGLAAGCFVILLGLSWYEACQARSIWQALQNRRQAKDQK